MKKQYEGSCYIGVVGPTFEYGTCRDSIQRITRRNGDDGPIFIRATKGYEARQMHLNKFIDSKHDFLLLLDHDMEFPADTLERLRGHGLPYVSGFYMRRQWQPGTAPIWFDDNPKGLFPMSPYLGVPEPGTLVKLGASGWGCILVHRDVVMAVQELLKGEPEIIEDDMDVWPYDLDRLMGAVKGITELVETNPPARTLRAALKIHAATLKEEVRPLRGNKTDIIGSDIRFPFYARRAGYQLWGDPAVQCGHMIDYPLTYTDWAAIQAETAGQWQKENRKRVQAGRRRIRQEVERLGGEA